MKKDRRYTDIEMQCDVYTEEAGTSRDAKAEGRSTDGVRQRSTTLELKDRGMSECLRYLQRSPDATYESDY